MDDSDHGKEEQQRDEGHSAQPSTSATPSTPATPITNATPPTRATPRSGATPPAGATPRKGGGKRKVPETPSRSGKKVRTGSLFNTSASQTCRDEKLEKIKQPMDKVLEKLGETDDSGIVSFLRESIEGLKPDKKELVGVFGKTGAGKSSLINAVTGKKDLLPTGKVDACTSVIIKVKANTENHKYISKVKFISEEDFNNELEFLRPYFGDSAEEEREDCDDDDDYKSKLTALFGDEWKNTSLDSLKESKRYKDIIKNLKKQTVEFSYLESNKDQLGADLKKYTKDESEDDPSKTWYWPVVKTVTIKVPNNELLRHVTLVDLPGNGDCNKTRNEMWKQMISSCGTVWVVTEVNRATSEQEAWEILESACKYMGHGGECRYIHFICTKLDHVIKPGDDVAVFKESIKKKVSRKITNNKEFKKHFTDDCFKVFTVSAEKYFDNDGLLTPEETGIPELQKVIKKLNSQEERASRYVTDAYGILSLMKGARTQNDEEREQVRQILSKNVDDGLKKIEDIISDWYEDFDQSLTTGVTDAKASCEEKMRGVIDNKRSKIHHTTLKCVVEKNGVHITMKGKEINLNTTLSLFLTEQIDDHFRKVFPNDHRTGSFYSIINDFSLNTEGLLKDKPEVELWLRFLQQEEVKLKRKLCQEILNRKKSVYRCLTETVQSEMQPCYDVAKEHTKKDALKNMRETITQHLKEKKSSMFDQAKAMMLEKLKELMTFVTNDLQKHMDRVINLPLSHGEVSAELPDISEEFSQVEDLDLYWSLYQKN